MKSQIIPIRFGVAVAAAGALCRLYGGTLYYDANGTQPGFGTALGTWGADAVWSTDATGTAEPTAMQTKQSDILNFGTKADALGAGTISIPKSQSLQKAVLWPAEGTLVFSGTGGLAFGPDGKWCLADGASAVVDAPVVTAGNLDISADMPPVANYLGDAADKIMSKDADLVLFTHADLAHYEPTACAFNAMGRSGAQVRGQGTICFVERDTLAKTMGFQCQVHDGGWTKCVKVLLSQDGDDIVGRIAYAKYYSAKQTNLVGRVDFDEPSKSVSENSVARVNETGSWTGGYNVDSFGLTYIQGTAEPSVTQFMKPMTVGGDFSVGIGQAVRLADRNAVAANGVLTNDIALAGTLVFCGGAHRMELQRPITGAGMLRFEKENCEAAPVTITAVLKQTDWTKVAENLSLGCVSGASGQMSGKSVNNRPVATKGYHRRFDGTVVTFQMQIDNGGFNKCLLLEVKEEEGSLYARTPEAWYATSSKSPVGTDLSGSHSTGGVAVDASSDGYCLTSLTLEFATGGMCVEALESAKLPAGKTELENGILSIAAKGGIETGIVPKGGTLSVTKGMVVQQADWPFSVGGANGESAILELDASTFQAGNHRPSSPDALAYVNRVTFANGSSICGKQIRFGYAKDCCWHVIGKGASHVSSGIMAVGGTSSANELVFDVEETSGDELPDLLLDGAIVPMVESGYANYLLRKRGAGTMRLSQSVSSAMNPFVIDAGTVQIGADNILAATRGVCLNGGTLSVLDGVSVTGNELTITDDSAICVGEGATLAFSDVSGLAWSDGKTLVIKGLNKGNSLRIGSSATALTKAQIDAIRVEKKGSLRKAVIDESGYLHAQPLGLVVIVQ